MRREAGGTLARTPEAGLFRRIFVPRWRPRRCSSPVGAALTAATPACAAARTVRARCTQPTASWTPNGVRTVSYHGVEFDVPAGWPVYDLAADPTTCVRFDVHAVYLGHPGADMSCPATVIGRADAVLVEPVDGSTPADGRSIRRGHGRRR